MRFIVILLLIDQLIININILNLNNARLDVIKRLRHVYLFCFFFEVFVDALRRSLAKFIIVDNRDRMRNQ